MNVYIQDDGVYVDTGHGSELRLDGSVLVNADGSVTVRFKPGDVTSRLALDHLRSIDMRDLALLKLAVVRGGLTVAEINQVRPALATAIQNYLNTNGLSAGQVA